MIDPGWAIRTPDQNDLLLKAAPGGLPSMMAALAAYTAEMASTETAAGVSTSNMVALNAEFQGATSVASTATVTGINTVAHLLFGWLAEKPPLIGTAVNAFTTAYSSMIPAALCVLNREEWGMFNALNTVLPGMFVIPMADRDREYFGHFWPNNASTGAAYSATLTSLMPLLAVPPPITPQNAAPAMPAAAASAMAETAATTAAGDAMRASSKAAGQFSSAGNGAGSFMDVAQNALGPAQKAFDALPQAFEGILGMPTSMMQPAMSAVQGLTGMFGGSFNGANAGAAGDAIRPGGAGMPGAGGLGVATGGGGGGIGSPAAAQGMTSYVRPASGFAPENGGRATGLRSPGLLNATEMRGPAMAGGGAMPMGPAGMLARGQGEGGQEQVTRARIVTEGDRDRT